MPTQAVSNLDESAPLDDPHSLPSDDTDSVMGQLVFGNDIDAVDIAVRVAMVQFFTSPNILGGIKEHTRTLRLFSRPVVALQRGPFLKSRTNMSEFVLLLSESQVNNQYQRNERCHAIHPCHTAAILSRETKRALLYHTKPRNGNHWDEA